MELKKYFEVVTKVLNNLDKKQIDALCDSIEEAYNNENFVFVIGNGGSAANASHFAQDLAKGVFINNNPKKRLKVLSLVDNFPFISALANDTGYENVFTGQLVNFAKPGDHLIIISGSGNSKNIVEAVKFAKELKMKIIGITGYDGGFLKQNSDIKVHVPLNEMCMVESIHSVIFHYVISELKRRLFNDSKDFDTLNSYN